MDLGEELLARAEAPVADALRGVDGLDALVRAHLAAARAAWKDIRVDDARFIAHVARALPADDATGALEGLHAADLYLALACGIGDARAIAVLERSFVAEVHEALTRLASKVPPDEVVQILRAKLLVAEAGAAPKILDYSGRGPLAGWLRIAAIRTGLDLTRRNAAEQARPGGEALLDVPTALEDPELEHIRARHSADFKAAFKSLSKEDRNILRRTSSTA
jgi:RNA polymerase sigma-70 factor (ECF subfamily)